MDFHLVIVEDIGAILIKVRLIKCDSRPIIRSDGKEVIDKYMKKFEEKSFFGWIMRNVSKVQLQNAICNRDT